MERDEFLKSLGLGLALVCTGSCMSGCGKGSDGPEKPPTNPPPGGGGGGGGGAVVDLATTIKNIGDSTVVSGVLFYRIAAGDTPASFVATESVCPHQGGNLVWKQAANRVECQLHFSQYSTSGAVLQGPQGAAGSTRALKIYSTSVAAGKLTATVA